MKKFSLLMALILFVLTAYNNRCSTLAELTGISLNKKSVEIEKDSTAKLVVIYEPEEAENGALGITWESSDENIATVSDSGKVTGVNIGTTTITAYCSKLYAECEVIVMNAPDPGTDHGADPNPEVVPIGAISGKFSVSSNTQVYFSQGNLQYQASTDTWRFAEHQYDMIGKDNENISSTYSGWIDLFGWCVGNNPTNTSTKYYNYRSFKDCGVNTISNGGNIANTWRTLTKDEWVYLFYGRPHALTLFGLGRVNGVNGTILLPDVWMTPNGVTFIASTTRGLVDQGSYFCNLSNKNGNNFTNNTYTTEQWELMESAGAVFLPAAGARSVSGFSNIDGNYWSTTPYDSLNAYAINFYSVFLGPQCIGERPLGLSVRLVQ